MEQQTTSQQTNTTAINPDRRRFLNRVWAFLGVAAIAEFCWLGVSFLLSRNAYQQQERTQHVVTAGKVEQFKPATVTAIPQGQFYLACLPDGGFLALSQTCTHLGCSIGWDEQQKQFVCPCHGSTYNFTGEVLTAPAPRPLDYYPVRIENGFIKVDITTANHRDRFDPDQATQI